MNAEVTVKVIDSLKTVLGTMVMMPEYETNPEAIGQKIFKGNQQVPIVMGDSRKVVEDKLIELIKGL